MSYILDALKKDKSSKEQDKVPDLSSEHAQYEFEEEKGMSRWLWPVVVMLLIFTIAVLVFMLLNPSAQQVTQSIAQVAQATQVNNTVEADSSAHTATQTNNKPAQENSDTVVTSKPLAVRKPVVERVVRKAQAVKSDIVKEEGTGSTLSSETVTKKSLPKIIYTTHIYATQPKDRFVMLNGKAHGQGDTVITDGASNLVIKEILENDLVVVYKGQEFVLPSLEDVNAN